MSALIPAESLQARKNQLYYICDQSCKIGVLSFGYGVAQLSPGFLVIIFSNQTSIGKKNCPKFRTLNLYRS